MLSFSSKQHIFLLKWKFCFWKNTFKISNYKIKYLISITGVLSFVTVVSMIIIIIILTHKRSQVQVINQSINSFQPIRMQEHKLTNRSLKAITQKGLVLRFYPSFILQHRSNILWCTAFFLFQSLFFIREKSERTVLFWTFWDLSIFFN